MSRPASPRRRDWQVLVDSAWFPVVVWAVWRLAQVTALVAVGGHPVGDTFRFDAAWYRSILAQGYQYDAPNTVQQNPAFPPGLPWLTEPFSWVAGDKWAAFLVANLTGLAALRRRLVGAAHLGRRSLGALRHRRPGAVAHVASTCGRSTPRALFVAATAVGLGAERKGRRWLVAACAVVAGVTRVVGLLFGPVLAVRALVAGTPPRPDRVPVPRRRCRGRGARHRRAADHHRPRASRRRSCSATPGT